MVNKKSPDCLVQENPSDTSWFWLNIIIPTIFKHRQGRCEVCGSVENLDVHHTSYEIQTINTLKLLCRQCHKDWHQQDRFTDEEYMTLYNERKTDEEASVILGVSKTQVLRRRIKLGLRGATK